ncbi:MAG: hypothetical protein H0V66_01440 [Bdellovibrionales bacterium]|nr:hypothetical protein [Bdellovibrionales bacterium]
MKSWLLLLFFLVGCNDAITTFEKIPEVKIKKIPVASKAEAKKVISNHLSFLTLLFQQSVDPYFNTQKWPSECLLANKIGELKESDQGLQFISRLYLGPDASPGHCSNDPAEVPGYVIYLYCQDEPFVYEIKYHHSALAPELKVNLCD